MTNIHHKTIILGALCCLSMGCAQAKKPAPVVQKSTNPKHQSIAKKVLATMNPKADPCTDFYQYACGGWLKSTKMPDDQARWIRSFNVISSQNDDVLKTILAQNPATLSPENKKVVTYYKSCMDEATIAKRDATPLEPWFKKINGLKNSDDLFKLLGTMHDHRIGPLFYLSVGPDAKAPTTHAVGFRQGGLGLMYNKQVYIKPKFEKLRAAYIKHMSRMFVLAGTSADQAQKDALSVMSFETELAKISNRRDQLRDPDKTYNKVDLAAFIKQTQLPLNVYLSARSLDKATYGIVQVPSFFAGLAPLLKKTPMATIQTYLKWHTIRATAGLLSKPWSTAHFDFFGKTVNGQKQQRARWKQCVSSTNSALGFQLGQMYVKRAFAGESKKVANNMVRTIEGAFEDHLNAVTWMDDKTRARAKGKLHTIDNKIGYPDKWRVYDGLNAKQGQHFENVMAARLFESKRRLSKLGTPVHHDDWYMTPSTVNAYYTPSGNQIVFPAGILQAPFFDKDFPMAMNFGGIGMVIGHEITHGFDDGGRKFDEKGRLTMWWQPETIKRFEARAQCVNDAYSAIEVQPGYFINGTLTLGENIADHGGLKLAYLGYQKWLKDHPERSPVQGLSNDKLFFVNFAQTWCALGTQENERQRLVNDSHSPPKYRINTTLSHSSEFHKVFSCKEGTPMRPKNQCVVW